MGIKGIYGEIGAGERVALAKLAVEHLQQHGRPFRIAVDIAIWQFQVQSGKGGTNPLVRTLYYRLLKLLKLSIQPLFIFDGPNKPPFKRNKRSAANVSFLPDFLTKQMLKLFGFPYITAPGEAEAECALLQREGVVDAVLSEDIDTLMFGSERLLRRWTSEGVKGNKSPTHVNLYDASAVKQGKSGLDREGMVLVALMSGGDYIPAGVRNCGVKTACEAARAGFGRDLFEAASRGSGSLKEWRQRLQHELHTNESKFFRTKHLKLEIPATFPDRAVLFYYMHPVVSAPAELENHRKVQWNGSVEVQGLRNFVSEAFGWEKYIGARHFVRGLAPALLSNRLSHGQGGCDIHESLEEQMKTERASIKIICGRRTHATTGGVPEMRVAFIPTEVVGIDIENEPREYHTPIYDSDFASENGSPAEEGDGGLSSTSPTKKRNVSTFEPTEAQKEWILEAYVKLGAPMMSEDWESSRRNPVRLATRKARDRSAMAKGRSRKETLDQFVKITKPGVHSDPQNLQNYLKGTEESATTSSLTQSKTFISPNLDLSTPPSSPSKRRHQFGNSPQKKTMYAGSRDANATPWTLSRRTPAGLDNDYRNVRERVSTIDEDHAVDKLSHKDSDANTNIIVLDSSPITPRQPDVPLASGMTQITSNSKNTRIQEDTDTSSSRPVLGIAPAQIVTLPDTPPPVNRRLNFETCDLLSSPPCETTVASAAPPQSPPMFPLSQSPKLKAKTMQATAFPQGQTNAPRQSGSGSRVVLRQSLEGTWKIADKHEKNMDALSRSFAEVEILDLTTE